jgi:hypothetical protein
MIDVEDHLAPGSPIPADLYDCFLRSDRTPDAPAHHLTSATAATVATLRHHHAGDHGPHG